MFWNRNHFIRFHQIILIGIFSILIGSSEPFRKLSPDENQSRLKSCGNFKLPQHSQDANGVIITKEPYELNNVVTFTACTIQQAFATATAISSRHILTSSHVFIDGRRKWRWTGQSVQCSAGSADLDVPSEVLKSIDRLPLTRATIFDVCDPTNKDFKYGTDISRSLMLAETNGTFNDYFCLASEVTSVHKDELLDSYGLAWNKGTYELYHRKLKFVGYGQAPHSMFTEGYISKDEFASALVKEKDGKNMLLGIGSANNQKSVRFDGHFFKIVDFKDTICSLAGICDPKTTTTTTTTTTTPIPTTPTSTNSVITIPMNNPPTTTTSQPPSTPSTSSDTGKRELPAFVLVLIIVMVFV
ncbi:hypothetical protein L3Y34_016146 [Caenorhabditis briggsae]|uniref:Peptidase S1 domain-containing protein n=1 Tax=Caenorhabditis briggsae TaxID=6238 RepID=A0AAE9DWL3_CAEBR|nr:hypothetical protein L3Y34_016146 [Caenorhabditis briggsae]